MRCMVLVLLVFKQTPHAVNHNKTDARPPQTTTPSTLSTRLSNNNSGG